VKHLAIALIRAYQICVSPYLPSNCIYNPSCSNFALEAYRRHGFWRGTWLTGHRLVRCGPWCAGGEDPVR